MGVVQDLGQHVGAGDGELLGLRRQVAVKRIVAGEVEPPVAERAGDDPGRQRPVRHAGLLPPGPELIEGQLGLDSLEWTDEVIDHPVGLGVVDVPAIELPVGDHVDAGQFLGLEHDQHRVAEALAGVVDAQPGGDRIAADNRSLDHRGTRLSSTAWLEFGTIPREWAGFKIRLAPSGYPTKPRSGSPPRPLMPRTPPRGCPMRGRERLRRGPDVRGRAQMTPIVSVKT